MRKIAKKALLLTALSVVFLTATAAAADMGTGVVDADSLRVRVEPSTALPPSPISPTAPRFRSWRSWTAGIR